MTEWHWWQRGVIYQVYPRSFQDSDGDGVGDLAGIAARLPHLRALGVDALWLSPIYPSPMADFGYDVADYCGVDALFGTLAAFDALVAAAHAAGLRVILDFVPNHSSSQHPWFLDSRSSRGAAHRDWYIWRDPAPGGGPPNNWLSRFGGGGWEWDAGTGQYYLHSFLKEQPDLNWRNPAVQEAMASVLRFWMDRGVDGFRIDVLWLLVKDDQFRDNPPNPDWRAGEPDHDRLLPVWNADRPETLERLAALRRVTDEYGERVLIGEIYLPLERLVAYYGPAQDGAQLPFNFQLLLTRWDAATIAGVIARYEAALPHGAWPNWVLGNHDNPRIATRVGSAQARVAAMLLLTLRGTPTIYNGEELGLEDVEIAPEQVRDPAERRQPGIGLGRDPERTPMPWDGSPGAGFTTGVPWLPIGEENAERHASGQAADPRSMLTLYRALLALRRATPALAVGAIAEVRAEGNVLRYERDDGTGGHFLVLLNLGGEPTKVAARGAVVLSTFLDGAQASDGVVALRGDEGVVLKAAT